MTTAAHTALWGAVRIVVIDVETTTSPDGLRAVSFAAVTCRSGSLRGRWQSLIDPGVPIDTQSTYHHGIIDGHVAGEPVFADLSATIIDLFTERDGERLVIAAHNIGFDIGVIRAELERCGLTVPDVAVIDTMGKLAGTVDVHPDKRSLAALCETLGIVNSRPHDALADAVACAEALVELLHRAANNGHTDFDVLLHDVSAGATTSSIRASKGNIDGDHKALPVLPPEHVATHTKPLSPRAGTPMMTRWRNDVAACAQLRCRHLDDRVRSAGPAPTKLTAELEHVLADACRRNDTPGAATVLGALTPLLEHMPSGKAKHALRRTALAWAKQWGPELNPLGRCDRHDQCPACRRGEPCPLDMWSDTIAAIALGDPASTAQTFMRTRGAQTGTGTYLIWRDKGVDERISGAALWSCVQHWRNIGLPDRGEQTVNHAWHNGCLHPDIVDAYAGQVASPGRLSNLHDAIAACDTALSAHRDSTHDSWLRLRSRRNQLAGRARRLTFKPSGKVDEHGEPIPVRRHHPANPKRTRSYRFIQNEPVTDGPTLT